MLNSRQDYHPLGFDAASGSSKSQSGEASMAHGKPLTPAFWDSSALVPLCVQQQASAVVRRLSRQYEIAAWWSTSVEVRSAFARLIRAGDLDQAGLALAETSLNRLLASCQEIRPDDAVRSGAEAFLRRFPLSAADALQLSAAITWAGGKPRGRVFICGDVRLLEAAEQLGFRAVEA
jgi:predicted nucleic acid-binding protein